MIHNNIKELNEFQKKKIKDRLSLDFFSELDNNNTKKKRFFEVFSKQIEVLVKSFQEKGILFYSLSIDYLFENDNWEKIYLDIEEFINYIGCNVELIEFSYFSIELKNRKPIWQGGCSVKKTKLSPTLNVIIGVRSILGKNKLFICEMQNLFIMPFFDIKVKWLQNYSEIIKHWNFVIKQKNFKFHRFVNYSDFYPAIYGLIADEELKFNGRVAFGQENHFISNTNNVIGIKKKIPKK